MLKPAIAFVVVNALVVRLPFTLEPDRLAMALPIVLLAMGLPRVRYAAVFAVAVLMSAFSVDRQLAQRVTSSSQPVLQGSVCSLPTYRGHVVSFRFCLSADGAQYRLSWYQPAAPVAPGQVWQFAVKLGEPVGSVNFYAFDYEKWQFANRIHGRGYVLDDPPPLMLADAVRSIDLARNKLRQSLAGKLPETEVATVLALSLGDTGALLRDQWNVLNSTGTTHLLVVSGLHVGLIATIVAVLVRALGLPLVWGSFLTIFAASGYALLAGFGLPVQRALIMTITVIFALNISRHVRPQTQFSLAIVAVLFFDPLATLSNGFWLSFGAVAALLFGLQGWQIETAKWKGALRAQWVVYVLLSAPIAYLMAQIPLSSLFVNLIAIPWVGVVVVPMMLFGILLLSLIPDLGQQILLIVSWQISLLWQFLHWAGSQEMIYRVPAVKLEYVLLAIAGGATLLLPKPVLPRWSGLVLLALLFRQPDKLPFGSARVTFLDVGQGLSVLVETRSAAVLYDTGPSFNDQFNAASQIVLPALRAQGWDRLERLIISHSDNDHAGGKSTVMDAVTVAGLLEEGRCDDSWTRDGVSFSVFSSAVSAHSANDSSCMMRLEAGTLGLLLTGDIEEKGELALASRGLSRSDVISSPHHGSITSSSPAFLNAVGAGVVVISAGYQNRFGHPHRRVLARYSNRSMRILNTAEDGAVRILLHNDTMHVRTARSLPAGVWRRNVTRDSERQH